MAVIPTEGLAGSFFAAASPSWIDDGLDARALSSFDEPDSKKTLRGLLANLSVVPNTDVEWWGLGGVLLNEGTPRMGENGWDYRSDLVGELTQNNMLNAIAALPLVINGSCHALAILGIDGQWSDEGCFLITASNWEETPNPYQTYGTCYSRSYTVFSTGLIDLLLNSFTGQKPGRYPPNIHASEEEYRIGVDMVLETILVGLTRGILRTGFDGLEAAKPYLAHWFTTQLETVIELLS